MAYLIKEFMIAAITGAVVGGGFSFWYYSKIARRDIHYKLQVFQEKRRSILREATYRTGAVNALVLKIHNGGGKLIDSALWYSSVIDEYPTFESVSAIEHWQNVVADNTYRELIGNLKRNGIAYPQTEAMPASDLKGVYLAMGIEGSVVMKFYEDEYFFYYVSFPTHNFTKIISSDTELQRLKFYQRKLMRLYENYQQYDIPRIDWESSTKIFN